MSVPQYGHRKGFIPRTVADFGGGGAFPEIHVLQRPTRGGGSGAVHEQTPTGMRRRRRRRLVGAPKLVYELILVTFCHRIL